MSEPHNMLVSREPTSIMPSSVTAGNGLSTVTGGGMLPWWARWELPLGVVALVVVFYLGPASVVDIPSGKRGVKFARWGGTIADKVLDEGIHFKAPWDKVELYDIRVRQIELMVPIRVEGREFDFDLNVQYRLAEERLPQLHEQVGPDFEDVVISDEVSTALRELLDEFDAAQIGALAARPIRIQRALGEAIEQGADGFVIVDDVIIERVRSAQIGLETRTDATPDNKKLSNQVVEELKAALKDVDGTPIIIVIEGRKE